MIHLAQPLPFDSVRLAQAVADRSSLPIRYALLASMAAHALAVALLPGWRGVLIPPDAPPQALSVSLAPTVRQSLLTAATRPDVAARAPASVRPMPASHVPPSPAARVAAAPAPKPVLALPVASPMVAASQTTHVVPTVPAASLQPAHAAVGAPASDPAVKATSSGDDSAAPLVAAHVDLASLSQYRAPYPLSARRRGIEGTVILRIEVLPSGEPGQVEILQSSGDESLDASARDSVRRWRFHPARHGGKPVTGWARLPYQFRLEE